MKRILKALLKTFLVIIIMTLCIAYMIVFSITEQYGLL